MRPALIIFTRNPILGSVKTRLAAGIGDEAALKFYLHLIEVTINACKKLKDTVDIHVFYSEEIEPSDVWSSLDCTKHVQRQVNDLGGRMLDAFRVVFQMHYHSAIIIGTDCPYLTADLLSDAYKKLKNSDLVIGPSKDGGFYLLGVNQIELLQFNNIKWSTNTVYDSYLRNIVHLSPSKHVLPTLEDIDDYVSYNQYKQSAKFLNYNNL